MEPEKEYSGGYLFLRRLRFHEKHETVIMYGIGCHCTDDGNAHAVFAASDYKYITNISLKVSIDLDSR